MTERVAALRQQSLDAAPSLSSERAELLTEFYQSAADPTQSTAMRRALAFHYIMERKTIYIGQGELIVGEKGPAPKAAPTYPELCCHTLEDLDLLHAREKTPFAVSEHVRSFYRSQAIPFWHGKTMRERLFAEMTPAWRDAYAAGVFTEFMEQRSPGHTTLDDKIYRNGMLDFTNAIRDSIDHLDYFNDPAAWAKREELRAMVICADALILFAGRHANKARDLANAENDPQRAKELRRIADICSHVPAHAPRNFWEALQCYWFVHLGVTIELNPWDSFNPGRLDQHLLPFYQKGLQDGTLTREKARELLHCLWIKFNNQPAPPKVGVTAAESGTYTDFAQINMGGVTAHGSDGVNEVSYLLLDVIEEMRLLQPSSSIQVSKKNPDQFIKRAAQIIRTGFGQPSVFNHDLVVQEMLRVGKSIEDARNGGTSGCVETGAFGKEDYNLTGYFNMPKILELTLHDGIDPRTGKQLGLRTGAADGFTSFEELFAAFEQQLRHFIDIKIEGNNIIERLYAACMPAPFLSLLIDDCIVKGRDYHDGGARYDTSYIQGVGLGSITDALSSIKRHVYDKGTLTLAEMVEALDADFVGHESLRQLFLNKTPKFGNDDDDADSIMRQVFEAYYRAIDGRPNSRGGRYAIDLLPTTCHVYFGSVTGALPDGRKAGLPLSEGISPVQGADRRGPTAVIRSVAKMDHVRTGGTLLNQKFAPQLLSTDKGLDNLVHLIRTHFNLDCHHIQFNVVDADTLKKARQHPEDYRDLIVRVAGYSDYFCDLSEALQEEIIARTEQKNF
ncbi:glycyl radical protein [candidate division KSB1 bacterium]|nr:glycyl radical protein [candidate division KSB1 bacterium]RQW05982.1 MAG: glycyl radical protein [candidate division KSB1 bacterium]